jgi:hypothetical protein
VTARRTSCDTGLMVPLRAATFAEGGGKAGGLALLISLGVAVPDGWVLTLRADLRRRAGQLGDEALDLLIRESLAAGDYPPGCAFAVRSSARTEESAQASYAGQFRSGLNVACEDVPAAVRRVAAPASSPSARSYARRLGRWCTSAGGRRPPSMRSTAARWRRNSWRAATTRSGSGSRPAGTPGSRSGGVPAAAGLAGASGSRRRSPLAHHAGDLRSPAGVVRSRLGGAPGHHSDWPRR